MLKEKLLRHVMILFDALFSDINECFSTKLNRCPKNAYCMNTEGSYKCLLNCPSPNYQVVVLDKVCAGDL